MSGSELSESPRAFKHRLGPEAVHELSRVMLAGTASFPSRAFVREASAGLEALELKDRVRHIASVLRQHVPTEWPLALDVLLRGMGPALPEDGRTLSSGFGLWPVLHTVGAYGLDHPEISLRALREMTQRFSAEFAVRGFLERHPEQTWAVVEQWASDPNVHVRRLASEGTRPRLPWGKQVPALIADPSRGLALLERLRDDPARYVQRSVANHLGDVAKDHPERVVRVVTQWMVDAPEDRRWLVRHGTRTLVKQGHPGALALHGYAAPRVRVENLETRTPIVHVGGALEVACDVVSTGEGSQALLVDLVVFFRKKRGPLRPKVFKGRRMELGAGETWHFSKSLPLRRVSTRRYYPGAHRVAVQINGQNLGELGFELT